MPSPCLDQPRGLLGLLGLLGLEDDVDGTLTLGKRRTSANARNFFGHVRIFPAVLLQDTDDHARITDEPGRGLALPQIRVLEFAELPLRLESLRRESGQDVRDDLQRFPFAGYQVPRLGVGDL
ncbi:hypothetical protein [Streptomyces sp. SID3343]|uniref:hypothetical protein n=1 Tax=Streptomyces sp. SID3343 TaxID=2690260 RepID=UPI00136A2810|nr:hypothetical protein [Streptomyces sp. SID3343]